MKKNKDLAKHVWIGDAYNTFTVLLHDFDNFTNQVLQQMVSRAKIMELYQNVVKLDNYEQRFNKVKLLDGISEEFLYQNYNLGFSVSPLPDQTMNQDSREVFLKFKVRAIEKRILDVEKRPVAQPVP